MKEEGGKQKNEQKNEKPKQKYNITFAKKLITKDQVEEVKHESFVERVERSKQEMEDKKKKRDILITK